MRLFALLAVFALALPAYAQAPGAFETITVSTTAIGLDADTIGGGTTGLPERKVCFMTLESADIRWRVDGLDPDGSTGHIMAATGTLTIEGYVSIVRFKAIRDGASDGTLSVTCW